MWVPAGVAASSAVTATLLSLGHRTDCYGLLFAMAAVDFAQHLDDNLYERCMTGIDHLGILLHPATLRGKNDGIQFRCGASSKTLLAESAGKVQCQGDGNWLLFHPPRAQVASQRGKPS